MSMDDQAAVHEAIENHRYNPGKRSGVLRRRERGGEGERGREREGAGVFNPAWRGLAEGGGLP